MKIGLVVTSPPQEIGRIEDLLRSVKKLGFEGIGFRSILQISQRLDPGELESARQCGEDLGLFLSFGIGWVNPFNALSRPDMWAIGEGDYVRAVCRQIEIIRKMGCKEIAGEIAGVKGPFHGRYAFDRFRTDISWKEQLEASLHFLQKILPILVDTGVRINLENHEDLTTSELIRLIETIGHNHLGCTLDAANLPVMGEHPIAGSLRVAQYTHLAHIKDIYLLRAQCGLLRQIRPAGEGVIAWEEILPAIYRSNPNTRLLVEDHKGLIQIDVLDAGWQNHFPECSQDEIQELFRLADHSRHRVERGEIEGPEIYEAIPYEDQRLQRLASALCHLKSIREKYALEDNPGERIYTRYSR